MCGIAGFINQDRPADCHALAQMVGRLHHRGPDDEGFWIEDRVALGFRRLSILDLSDAGHQPMLSASGRFAMVFNGEIYNWKELRASLEPFVFRGHADSEVLVESFDRFGVERTLELAEGMFAIAAWDRSRRKLYLARDRFGEKPLYYGRCNGSIVFGSELKALTQHPGFSPKVDRASVARLLRYGYVPNPHSIYEDIHKLVPGTWLEVDGSSKAPFEFSPHKHGGNASPRSFWTWASEDTPSGKTDASTAVKDLRALLREVIGKEMVADVPLGAFLSGGIDSSLVVGIMQELSDRAVQTFTIGFTEPEFNEATYARAVADHLGTNHTELYVSARDALEVIPQLPQIYDEPFGDSSQIPTYLVAKLARQDVTVCLSGDGGDEMFGGYNRYYWALRLAAALSWLPRSMRGLMRVPVASAPDWALNGAMRLLKRGACITRERRAQMVDLLHARNDIEIYRHVTTTCHDPRSLVLGLPQRPFATDSFESNLSSGDLLRQMMELDSLSYLPDDIMTKVDRATMAVSLETRAPLLHHAVAEFSRSLPRELLHRHGKGKWILQELLDQYVPRSLVDRPKTGFGVPIDQWLCKELRDWGEALLDPNRLKQEGVFDADAVRTLWEEHQSGKRKHHSVLWNILMFQAWFEQQPLGAVE